MNSENPEPCRRDEPNEQLPRLLHTAITATCLKAEQGELPLFAWTLGLPREEHRRMHLHCLPSQPLPDSIERHYPHLANDPPPGFAPMLHLLQDARPANPDARSDWLARCLAIACCDESPLWQTLGMDEPQQVDLLMAHYFPRLPTPTSHAFEDWQQLLAHLLQRSLTEHGRRDTA